jgi:purine-cytosine permease-like protein
MVCLPGASSATRLFNYEQTESFAAHFKQGQDCMRWKLLLIAALLASVVGAGTALGLVYGLTRPFESLLRPSVFAFGALLIPVAAITFASIFVYRHTARRRRLQAMLTALLASVLTLTILLVSSALYTKPAPAPTPAPTPRNIG